MLRYIFSLRPIDICLVIMFTLFAVSITAGILILSIEDLRKWACRKMYSWAEKLENWKTLMTDDIPYEPWMDYQKWKETRP